MEDINKKADIAGTIAGIVAGLITGVLVVNYIIFPKLIGYTLLEALQLLK